MSALGQSDTRRRDENTPRRLRNATGRYLTNREWSGVWVSDRPLDNSEGSSGEALLQITIADDLLAAFEWVEEGKPYREWLVPAAVLNDAGTVRLLDESADYRSTDQ